LLLRLRCNRTKNMMIFMLVVMTCGHHDSSDLYVDSLQRHDSWVPILKRVERDFETEKASP
jgi:hypothetical protein